MILYIGVIGETLLKLFVIALIVSFVAATLGQTVFVSSIALIGAGVFLIYKGFKIYGVITYEEYISILFQMGCAIYVIVVFMPAAIEYVTNNNGDLFVFELRHNFFLQCIISIISTAVGVFLISVLTAESSMTVGFKPFGFFGILFTLVGIADLIPSVATVIRLFID